MSVKNWNSGHYGSPEKEPVGKLNLKNHKWKGTTINLDIEIEKPNGHRKNIWYKVTGKEAERDGEIVFTPYTYSCDKFPNSVAIWENDNYEIAVKLLHKAGIITDEKTGRCTEYGLDRFKEFYTYYRLTDQAIEYANRKLR